jgi:hypothetical protein
MLAQFFTLCIFRLWSITRFWVLSYCLVQNHFQLPSIKFLMVRYVTLQWDTQHLFYKETHINISLSFHVWELCPRALLYFSAEHCINYVPECSKILSLLSQGKSAGDFLFISALKHKKGALESVVSHTEQVLRFCEKCFVLSKEDSFLITPAKYESWQKLLLYKASHIHHTV